MTKKAPRQRRSWEYLTCPVCFFRFLRWGWCKVCGWDDDGVMDELKDANVVT